MTEGKKVMDHNNKNFDKHDCNTIEQSNLARWPDPDLDPDVYLSLTPTPDGMKPIFNLGVRMCIGFYDKEGAIYDYQGVLTEHSISRTHPYYTENVSSTTLYDFSQEDWFPLLDAQHYIPKIILVHVIKNGIRSKDPNNYGFGLMYKMYTAIVFRYGQAMMVTVLVNVRTWEIRHFKALEPHNLDEKISQ